MVKRVRREADGTETEFRPSSADGPFRAEIEVSSADGLRRLMRDGKLLAVRMHGDPKGKSHQYSLVPVAEIEDFTW